MKFVAIIDYLRDKEKIAAVRPEHRKYLAGLRDGGQLAIAGPFTDDSGGLIMYEAATIDEAEKLLQGDPFHKNGIFLNYRLRPWNPVMAKLELFSSVR
jgi:uncharacterized protein